MNRKIFMEVGIKLYIDTEDTSRKPIIYQKGKNGNEERMNFTTLEPGPGGTQMHLLMCTKPDHLSTTEKMKLAISKHLLLV